MAASLLVHGSMAFGPSPVIMEGYLGDRRFVEYYDGACGVGATEFLRDIIKANLE